MLSVLRLITTEKMTTSTKVNYYSKDDNYNMDKWLQLNTWFNVDESVIFSLTFYGGRLLFFNIFVIWQWQVLNNFEYFRFCCADKMKIQSVRYLITGYKSICSVLRIGRFGTSDTDTKGSDRCWNSKSFRNALFVQFMCWNNTGAAGLNTTA